jgi:CMP/dCMP kinase
MIGKNIIITIDGPAGAGKTTVSRLLAKNLGYVYVDTGALYRAVALKVVEEGIDPNDDDALEGVCAGMTLTFRHTDEGVRLISGEMDVTDRIRTPEIAMLASAVSARLPVRAFLLDVQRLMGRKKCAVFEGRDMGTVVFPEAEVKFYLDASQKERALRRYRELPGNSSMSLDQVESDIQNRDRNDSSRQLAPLKPAHGAVVIDSTGIPAEEVVERMLEVIRRKISVVSMESRQGVPKSRNPLT